MASYFKNYKQLHSWLLSYNSSWDAFEAIKSVVNFEINNYRDEQDILEACEFTFDNQQKYYGAKVLFEILSKYNLTSKNNEGLKMKKKLNEKKASSSRQRNGWKRGMRNKWNRVISEFNESTPWRRCRDKYYDFTHNSIDDIQFDEDPDHIYSGEAIWRNYIMDKFYRDYKDIDGKVVGGYINDRFHVFPTAGTPDNPNVPRDHNNKMGLADGERSRQPRKHEYSIEKRLEELRGNKVKNIKAYNNVFSGLVKVASCSPAEGLDESSVFCIIRDTIEMRESDIDYELILDSVSQHYKTSVTNVAQIDKFAQKMIGKHNGYGYIFEYKKAFTLKDLINDKESLSVPMYILQPSPALLISSNAMIELPPKTTVVKLPEATQDFEIVDHPSDSSMIGSKIKIFNLNLEIESNLVTQEDAFDSGLNEVEYNY